MKDFSQYLIKDYTYWSVYIHVNQSYLGRCIVWCKRDDALDLADATKEERAELFDILAELKIAVKKVFNADWFNYAFLGNETRHLHGHFVPRYSSTRIFENVTFSDDNWGHNYKTDQNFITPITVLESIRLKLQEELK